MTEPTTIPALTDELIQELDRFAANVAPALERLWLYYRNPIRLSTADARGNRWYTQAQEMGLPARIVGARGRSDGSPQSVLDNPQTRQRREAVIENDIGWRIQAMVDFLAGQPVRIVSDAPDQAKARAIEALLEQLWEQNGGIALLQDAATLGHIYGHVDLALQLSNELAARSLDNSPPRADSPAEWLQHLTIQAIEPRRGFALSSAADYRELTTYVIAYQMPASSNADPHEGPSSAPLSALIKSAATRSTRTTTAAEIITGTTWTTFHAGNVMGHQTQHATAGKLPIIHVQNISQPFEYSGLSEVEPLIPLQDELNTRLSDRASRVTLQSFRMYLAKGMPTGQGAPEITVGPGQIWQTDNENASIEAFGGDAAAPGEEAAINELRQAMDKVSAIPPLASGVIQAKIGNLTSANALRITLMGVLAKTARKRITYGGGIVRMSRLVLEVLNNTRIFTTTPAERALRLEWADPLPQDQSEVLAQAETKQRLGVDAAQLLTELGYGSRDPSIT